LPFFECVFERSGECVVESGLPLAGKFPCKRKFWPVQGTGQGNQIYQEMARIFEPGQGNCEEILKIVYIRNKIELKVEIYLQ
jgi:hypothetical protein